MIQTAIAPPNFFHHRLNLIRIANIRLNAQRINAVHPCDIFCFLQFGSIEMMNDDIRSSSGKLADKLLADSSIRTGDQRDSAVEGSGTIQRV